MWVRLKPGNPYLDMPWLKQVPLRGQLMPPSLRLEPLVLKLPIQVRSPRVLPFMLAPMLPYFFIRFNTDYWYLYML